MFQSGIWKREEWYRGKFIDSNLVMFCSIEFEKFAPCKFINQLETSFIVCFESIAR